MVNKQFIVLALFSSAVGLRVENQEANLATAKAKPTLWKVEVRGWASTSKYWRFTTYCGSSVDEFEVKTTDEKTGKCGAANNKEHILVRKKTESDLDHVFIRRLGCADQDVRVVMTKPQKYIRTKCDFPKLLKYTYDVDCNWDSSVTPDSQTLMFGQFYHDYRMEEECSQICHVKIRSYKIDPRNQGCNTWVVKPMTADATSGLSRAMCYTSESKVLRSLGSPPEDHHKHRCGNTGEGMGFGGAGKPSTPATPAPTPYAACFTYKTQEECPAEVCEWSDLKANGWSNVKREVPICQDYGGSCGGAGFTGLESMTAKVPAVGSLLSRWICNIVGIVKSVLGMTASFKQNPAAGVYQAVTEGSRADKEVGAALAQKVTELGQSTGVHLTELEMDHNDEPVESFPTAFPKPAKREIKSDNLDIDAWRSQLHKEAKERKR